MDENQKKREVRKKKKLKKLLNIDPIIINKSIRQMVLTV
jgi:hypothetical protein